MLQDWTGSKPNLVFAREELRGVDKFVHEQVISPGGHVPSRMQKARFPFIDLSHCGVGVVFGYQSNAGYTQWQ